MIKSIANWLTNEKCDIEKYKNFNYTSRDFFQAKLDSLYIKTKDSLLISVIGEIGNNSFDHNLGNWIDVVGIIFIYDEKNKTIIIADRGQGIKSTISRIKKDIVTDEQAIKIAFTQIISGRAPEQRGNGLKFVCNVVKQNKWYLSLTSGNGNIEIKDGNIKFSTLNYVVNGCLAVISY
ncbi:hypothetical protein [Candidatus Ruminimicrobium bovinum]|uniref:hypothetical protein n=1 Tax=Candidatus Ruminimicrobium bovinum TaxID=3242779 RepID=UPI0039B92BDB